MQTAAGFLAALKGIIDPDRNYLLMASGALLIVHGMRKAILIIWMKWKLSAAATSRVQAKQKR